MKKSLRIYSLTFLFSTLALASCGGGNESQSSSNSSSSSSSSEPSKIEEDQTGKRAYFGDTSTFTRFSSRLGFCFLDQRNGSADIRLFVGLDGLPASGKVVSSSSNESFHVVSELEFAYSSLFDTSSIYWDKEVDFEPSYYLSYTFENVQEEAWFDTLEFSFEIGDVKAIFPVFNPFAIQAKRSEDNVAFTSVNGVYSAYKKNNKIQKAIVPAYAYALKGMVAENKGDIQALGTASSYEGAFQDCVELESIEIPSSILSIEQNAFKGTPKLRSITLPSSLESLGTEAFGAGNDFDEIVYEAKNLISASTIVTSGHLPLLRLSKSVESLPMRFFAEGAEPLKIVYEGTKEEFLKLKTKKNQNNGFFIQNVFCSDSEIAHITFHLEGGELHGQTEDVKAEVLSGGFIDDPGFPSKEGYAFEGWFTAPNGKGEKADLESAFAKDTDLYACWRELGPGYTLASPVDIKVNESLTFKTGRGYDSGYLRIQKDEDEKADFIYLFADKSASEIDRDISGSYASFNGTFNVYDSNGKEVPFGTDSSYSNDYETYPAQRLLGGYGIRVFVKPGQSFTVRARLNADTSYPAYGKLVVNCLEQEQDWFSEAKPIQGTSEVALTTSTYFQRQFYSYASHKEEDKAIGIKIQGMYSVNLDIYTQEDGGSYVLFGSFSGAITSKKTFHFLANKTYYFVIGGREVMEANQSVSFYLTDPEPGTTESSAVALTEGAVASVDCRKETSFYLIHLEEKRDCVFTLSGGNDEYAKTIKVYPKGEADNVVIEKTEPKKTGGNYGFGDYGTSFDSEAIMEPGDYIVAVGYVGSGASLFSLSYRSYVQGERFAYPYSLSSLEGEFSLEASEVGKYSVATSPFAGFYEAKIPASLKQVFLLDENQNVTQVAFAGETLRLHLTKGQILRFLAQGSTSSLSLVTSGETKDGLSVNNALSISLNQELYLTPYLKKEKADHFYVRFSVTEEGDYRLYPHSLGNGSYSFNSASRVQENGSLKAVDAKEYSLSSGSEPVQNGYTGQSSDFFATFHLTVGEYVVDMTLPAASQAKESSIFRFEKILEGETLETAKNLDITQNFELQTRRGAQYFTYKATEEKNVHLALTGDDKANFTLYYTYTEKNFLGEDVTKRVTLADRLLSEDYVEFQTIPGMTYTITVASSQAGTLKGTASHVDKVANGLLPEFPYSFDFKERTDDGVTRTVSELSPKQKANQTLYYAFTVPASGTYCLYTVSLGGTKNKGVDMAFTLWDEKGKKKLGEGSDCGYSPRQGTCIYTDDDTLDATLVAGTTYLIQLRKGFETEGITQAFGYTKIA